jgi:hypothetical protein
LRLEHHLDDLAAADGSECDRFGVLFATTEGGGEGFLRGSGILCGSGARVLSLGLGGGSNREQPGDDWQRKHKIVPHDFPRSVGAIQSVC